MFEFIEKIFIWLLTSLVNGFNRKIRIDEQSDM